MVAAHLDVAAESAGGQDQTLFDLDVGDFLALLYLHPQNRAFRIGIRPPNPRYLRAQTDFAPFFSAIRLESVT